MRSKIALQLFFISLFIIPSICIAGEIFSQDDSTSTYVSWNNYQRQFASTSLNNSSNSNDKKVITLNKTRYKTGGVIGTVLGLGLGHAIQGRYKRGLFFTALQVGSIFAFGHYQEAPSGRWADLKVAMFFIYIFMGLRAWEGADVWILPPSYKVIGSYQKENKFYITPSLYANNPSSQKIFSLSFRF